MNWGRFFGLGMVSAASLFAMFLSTHAEAQGDDPAGRRQQQLERLNRERGQNPQRGKPAGRRRDDETALKMGQFAPTFTLASPDGQTTFDLRESRGNRPVVLIFGSYT